MIITQNRKVLNASKTFASFSGIAIFGIGLLGFLGWLFNLPELKSVTPGLIEIKANATIVIMLSGISLYFKNQLIGNKRLHGVSQVCASSVTLIGFLTLMENITGWNIGIKELLFTEPVSSIIETMAPGRMEWITSLMFFLAGIALLILDGIRGFWMAQFFSVLIWGVGYICFAGYLYGIKVISGFGFFPHLALHTTVAFLLLGTGILLSRPERGLARLITSDSPGGTLLRRMLPLACILSVLAGWIQVQGEKAGVFDIVLGEVVMAIIIMGILTLVLFLVARSLTRADQMIRKSYDELKLAEERFHVLFNSGTDAIFVSELTDKGTGNFIEVNDIACKRLGYTREELLNRSASDINAPGSITDKETKLRTIKETGSVSSESVLVAKDGKEIPVEVSATIIDLEGKTRVLSIARDITARKQAEKEYHTILNTSLDGFWITDLNGNFLEVNDTYCHMTGYTREELLQMGIQGVEVKETQEDVKQHIHKVMAEGYDRFETRHQCKDKHIIDVEISVQYSDVRNGILIVFLKEITRRKEIEHELNKLNKAIEESNVSVIITDYHGNIEYVNPYFYSISGYSREETIGKNSRILKSDYHTVEYYKNLWDTILSGNTWQAEVCNRRKNGELYWQHATISPIKDSEGTITHFVSVQADITELKRTQTELEQAKEVAEAAIKVKSDFLTNITHELRTPMNSILGFTNLLSYRAKDEQEKNYLQAIVSSGKSLLNLINDLLDISKIESGKFNIISEDIDMVPFFNDLESLFAFKAGEKGLKFSVELDPHIPQVVKLDGARFRQVLINIIGNAIKFTHDGHVKIKVNADRVNPGNEKKNKINLVNLQIEVEDSGIGISQEFQQKIFGSFTQQDSQISMRYGGTGLGLAISKKLVEAMNGTIRFTSETGKGTTFYILFKNVPVVEHELDDAKTNQTRIGKKIEKREHIYQLLEAPDFNKKEILQLLEEVIMRKWDAIKDTHSVRDAEIFAGEVLQYGQTHHAQFLVEYSACLNKAIASFDVEAIESLKSEFPKISKELKKITTHENI